MVSILQALGEELFRVQRDHFMNCSRKPDIAILFSREGLAKARADLAAARGFATTTEEETAWGYPISVDIYQDEDFRVLLNGVLK